MSKIDNHERKYSVYIKGFVRAKVKHTDRRMEAGFIEKSTETRKLLKPPSHSTLSLLLLSSPLLNPLLTKHGLKSGLKGRERRRKESMSGYRKLFMTNILCGESSQCLVAIPGYFLLTVLFLCCRVVICHISFHG
jgi:hypothetical protein